MVGTQILWKNADLLSIDELVELAGYGLDEHPMLLDRLFRSRRCAV